VYVSIHRKKFRFPFLFIYKINCIYNQRNNQPAVAGERREWGASVGDGDDDEGSGAAGGGADHFPPLRRPAVAGERTCCS
jgi:hypothetical protein